MTDHHSRAAVAFAMFRNKPLSLEIRQFLARAIKRADVRPKYIICDKDRIFGKSFKAWCRNKHKIVLRYGAVGQHGSIAVIERFFRSIKNEWLQKIIVPLRLSQMRQIVETYARWYNHYRPHQGLGGATPIEIYGRNITSSKKSCFDPKREKLILVMKFLDKHRQLPVVELKKVA